MSTAAMRRILQVGILSLTLLGSGCLFDKTPDPGGDRPVVSSKIDIDASRTLGQMPEDIFGTNAASWNPSEDGTDQRFNDMMKVSGQRNIRWPGGSWSDEHIWDEIGTSDFWNISISESLAFINSFGGTMQPIVNFSGEWSGVKNHSHAETVQKAANWVRFMNIDHDYNAKYWEIGNEIYGSWEHGYTTGSDYGTRFAEFYKAMKAVDPSINIGAVAVDRDNGETWTGYNWWNRDSFKAMKAAGVTPDFLIIHTYPFMKQPMNPTNDAAILRVPGNISIITDTLDDCVRSYFGSEYVGRIKYRMTEYRSTDMVTCQTYLDAMFTAQCIMEMAKAGWAGANIWDIKNGPDPSTNVDLGYITTDDQPRPTYYVFPYLTKYMGRQMVDASSSDSLIRVYASKDGAGNLTLFVVNNSPDSNYDVQVNISGFTAGTAGTKWQMEPAGKTPGNAATPIQERTGMMINGNIQPDPLALDHISPVSVDVGQSFTLNLPGSAMVLLTIPNGK